MSEFKFVLVVGHYIKGSLFFLLPSFRATCHNCRVSSTICDNSLDLVPDEPEANRVCVCTKLQAEARHRTLTVAVSVSRMKSPNQNLIARVIARVPLDGVCNRLSTETRESRSRLSGSGWRCIIHFHQKIKLLDSRISNLDARPLREVESFFRRLAINWRAAEARTQERVA